MDTAADVSADGQGAAELALENAYLRERIAQMQALATENLSLLRRVAQLESEHIELDFAGPLDLSRGRASSHSAAAPRLPSGPVAPIRQAPPPRPRRTEMEPLPEDKVAVLVLGPVGDPGTHWRSFMLPRITDLLSGLPDGVCPCILSAGLPHAAERELQGLARRYGGQHAGSDPGEAEFRAAANRAVEVVRPALVINAGLAPAQALSMMELASRGIPTLAYLADEEPALLAGVLPVGADASAAATLGLIGEASCVLVTSPWEQAAVANASPGAELKTELYLRGANLTQFVATEPAADTVTDVLFAAERTGAHGLRQVLAAAEALSHQAGIAFHILAGQRQAAGRNVLWHGPIERTALVPFYRRMDCLVVPADCHGFSQTMMEMQATGRPCLVPAEWFQDALDVPSGTIPYAADGSDLATRILQLHQDSAVRAAAGVEAANYAREQLRRSHWQAVLRGIVSRVGVTQRAAA